MKKLLMFLCAVMLVFGMVGSASAIPYTDIYDGGRLYMSAHSDAPDDSVSWTFDITDDGFDPDTQDVTSASVALNFEDNSTSDWWEIATLDVGSNFFSWQVVTGDISFTITSLMTLSDSGTVDATLTAGYGDFYFNGATLTAEGTDPGASPVPAHTPEPGTLLLMGTGLLGLVGYGRKRFSKKS